MSGMTHPDTPPVHGLDIYPDGATPERSSYDRVLLIGRLRETPELLNTLLPAETLHEVLHNAPLNSRPRPGRTQCPADLT